MQIHSTCYVLSVAMQPEDNNFTLEHCMLENGASVENEPVCHTLKILSEDVLIEFATFLENYNEKVSCRSPEFE